MFKHAPTTRFVDILTSEEAYVFVRYADTWVALGLATAKHGDIEATMVREEAQALAEALGTAIAMPPGVPTGCLPGERGCRMMTEAALIRFMDTGTPQSEEGWLIVRYDETSVAIGMFLKAEGGIQVAMGREEAQAVLEALRTAIAGGADSRQTGRAVATDAGQPPARRAALIKFADVSAFYARESWLIVRDDGESVALCFLVRSQGATEFAMRRDDARVLLDILQAAVGG